MLLRNLSASERWILPISGGEGYHPCGCVYGGVQPFQRVPGCLPAVLDRHEVICAHDEPALVGKLAELVAERLEFLVALFSGIEPPGGFTTLDAPEAM